MGELKSDEEVVLTAVAQDGNSLPFAGELRENAFVREVANTTYEPSVFSNLNGEALSRSNLYLMELKNMASESNSYEDMVVKLIGVMTKRLEYILRDEEILSYH